ncbi:hypothetical protein MTR67_032186 [Solanum verrucosum]|uniref:Uncharacterized protein n=1 Tax=Solanum verrucosum TaxID=315347 RepID=A0AAF0U3Z6_SOLVR|nr:hypothetical protein MTR67_032186 [Solanum verrucosum]
MNSYSGVRQAIFEFCLSENLKNKLKRFVHIATSLRFYLLRQSLLVGEVQSQDFVVVVINLAVSTEVGLHSGRLGTRERIEESRRGERVFASGLDFARGVDNGGCWCVAFRRLVEHQKEGGLEKQTKKVRGRKEGGRTKAVTMPLTGVN